MYFIRNGQIEILINNQIMEISSDGDCIGEYAVMLGTLRAASARAVTYCDLFVLSREDLFQVMSYYPDAREECLQRAKKKKSLTERKVENMINLEGNRGASNKIAKMAVSSEICTVNYLQTNGEVLVLNCLFHLPHFGIC